MALHPHRNAWENRFRRYLLHLTVDSHSFAAEIWMYLVMRYGPRFCWRIASYMVDGPCCFSKRHERLDSEMHVATRVSGESCGPAARQPWEAVSAWLTCWDCPRSSFLPTRAWMARTPVSKEVRLRSRHLPQNRMRENAFLKDGRCFQSHVVKAIFSGPRLSFPFLGDPEYQDGSCFSPAADPQHPSCSGCGPWHQPAPAR